MVFDTTNFTGGLFNLLSSFMFWGVIALVFVVVFFGLLVIRKKRKLINPVIEVTSLGRGKVGIKVGKSMRGGWFKHNSAIFGLWDYGQEEIFKVKDGRQVLSVSSEDFQEINGKMGLMVMRSPEDPRILVPISRVKVENGELLTNIAPADYRSTVVDIIRKAEKETSDKLDKIMQFVFWGGIIIFSFIAIILITQMVKNGQTEAKDLILEAGRINTENLKSLCQGLQHSGEVIYSGTAP